MMMNHIPYIIYNIRLPHIITYHVHHIIYIIHYVGNQEADHDDEQRVQKINERMETMQIQVEELQRQLKEERSSKHRTEEELHALKEEIIILKKQNSTYIQSNRSDREPASADSTGKL